jgi:hypothetical protein
MEILEAYDLIGTLRGAAELTGCDHKTVTHYVTEREAAGGDWRRKKRPCPRTADYEAKIAELVERSQGKVRADKVHERLEAMGYEGAPRTTRRAVARAKTAYEAGHRRVLAPWVTEPGLWMQWDYGEGPEVEGRTTSLFCAWLAADRRGALPAQATWSPGAPSSGGKRRGGGLPGDRSGCGQVADQGGRGRHEPGAAQDGRGSGPGEDARRRRGGLRLGGRGRRRALRRRRSRLDPRPPRERRGDRVPAPAQRGGYPAGLDRRLGGVRTMSVETPKAPPLPAEMEKLLRSLRLPHVRRAAPEVLATAASQRWEPLEAHGKADPISSEAGTTYRQAEHGVSL